MDSETVFDLDAFASEMNKCFDECLLEFQVLSASKIEQEKQMCHLKDQLDQALHQLCSSDADLESERNEKSGAVDRIKTLEGELDGLRINRDALQAEKGEVQQMVEQLREQLSVRDAELENERNEKSSAVERIETLESVVVPLRNELSSYAVILKHVQKTRDDHAQSRYALARNINELNSELKGQIEALQVERNRADVALDQLKILTGQLAGVKGERDVRAKERDEAREETELTLLQMHQMQEELESVFLVDQSKQKQLEELKQHVSAESDRVKSLEEELAGVKGERDVRAKERDEAREEAELTLLQLHQVQEELEHYFLLSREQNSLLAENAVHQKRVEKLLNDVIPSSL